MNKPSVTIILPTFNESGNIVDLINNIDRRLNKSQWLYNFMVVDDNSPDGTANLVKKTFKFNKTVTLWVRENARGLATAALYGITRAKTDYILFMATDFNHHPKYIPTMLKLAIKHPTAIINGSRFLPGGGMYHSDHYWGSKVMNTIAKLILQTPASDYTGVFLLAHKADILSLPTHWIFRGHGDWGIRLLYLLHKRGIPIVEFPVYYPDRKSGDSKTIRRTYAFPLLKAFIETRLYNEETA